MTLEGLRQTLRYSTTEIVTAAKNIMEAEDLRAAGHDVPVPRYAAYSVWVCHFSQKSFHLLSITLFQIIPLHITNPLLLSLAPPKTRPPRPHFHPRLPHPLALRTHPHRKSHPQRNHCRRGLHYSSLHSLSAQTTRIAKMVLDARAETT